MQAGKIREDALTVTGKTIGENCREARSLDRNIIRTYDKPLKENAGLLVVSGNLFNSAVIKTSVISADFRRRYLSELQRGAEDCFTVRAIVFDGPEDYRRRIEDPALQIDETCMLVVRGAGPIGYPGSAEVVNMSPPGYLLRRDQDASLHGRRAPERTSESPSILNISPESAIGGNRDSRNGRLPRSTSGIGGWMCC